VEYTASEIRVEWQDGHRSVYPNHSLRCACNCAACVDERTGERTLEPGKVPADVKALGIRVVGNYALEFDWSDGHRTGIYSFDLLRRLCACPACQAQGSRG
jgi:DUF971 family protein